MEVEPLKFPASWWVVLPSVLVLC